MPSPTSMTGYIGEYLVCSDLRKHGYIAFPAANDCFYDVVLDIGRRLLRVQVKTLSRPSAASAELSVPSWNFNLYTTVNKKNRPYKSSDFDLLALAALDISKIAYVVYRAEVRTISVRSSDNKHLEAARLMSGRDSRYFQDLTLERALSGLDETADQVLEAA